MAKSSPSGQYSAVLASVSSLSALIVCVAPKRFAISSLPSSTSTAIKGLQPTAAAAAMAQSPMPPLPKTARLWPFCGRAVLMIAPNAVGEVEPHRPADDVDGEALATFVVNKLRGTFNVLAIKAPGYGDKKKEMLGDIAVIVGAQVISEDLGVKFENAELKMLGSASKMISTKDSTIVVGGKGKKATVEARVSQLRKQVQLTESKFDLEKLEERIAKLSGGVAVIKVGASTETEMRYLKLKIEDAVNATKAAIEEGIVAGGGTAFVKVAQKVSLLNIKPSTISFKDEFS